MFLKIIYGKIVYVEFISCLIVRWFMIGIKLKLSNINIIILNIGIKNLFILEIFV